MSTITIHSRFQHRRGTEARWKEVNPVLREGEIGLETDTRRIKFGDGVTAWNSLEYSTRELLPAENTRLGGIIAGGRGRNYTVEVRIDLQTHRLYVPAYPSMPNLAEVAMSGDYNDLENIPQPYTLPAATETTIGGVAAAAKTSAYTVEVKKDPASHKLYVPSSVKGSVEDDRLPGVVIRVVPKYESRSTHFPNEEGGILNGDIYFRPLCSAEYFNSIIPDLFFGLARCSSRHRQNLKKQVGSSTRSTQWHVIGEPGYTIPASERYPNIKDFNEYGAQYVPWTYEHIDLIPVSALTDTYEGEWIKFPHDLETVVRRFIYLYKITATQPVLEFTLLPIQELASDNEHVNGFIKISGVRNRTPLTKRTSASGHYASVNLGFCFSRHIDEPANCQRYLFGPIAEKRAIVVAERGKTTIKYLLKDSNRKKLIR